MIDDSTVAEARTMAAHDDAESVHVYPAYGQEHETERHDGECWCSPSVERVRRADGSEGILVIHREAN